MGGGEAQRWGRVQNCEDTMVTLETLEKIETLGQGVKYVQS